VFICIPPGGHSGEFKLIASKKIHIFIEKPMAVTLASADAIIKAKNDNGVKIMVGYMRTYDSAFTQGLEEIKKMDKINYVKLRDFIGYNEYFTDQGAVTHRFDDIPQKAKAEAAAAGRAMNVEAIGETTEDMYSYYGLMTGLCIHDISAMRTAFGMPASVVTAKFWNKAYANILFEYDGFYLSYEVAIDRQRRFDARIEVYGDEKTVTVCYDTPYLPNLPSHLRIGETRGEGYSETVIRPTYVSSFNSEIDYFYDCVTKDIEPRTSPEDARRDIEIFNMIIKSIKED